MFKKPFILFAFFVFLFCGSLLGADYLSLLLLALAPFQFENLKNYLKGRELSHNEFVGFPRPIKRFFLWKFAKQDIQDIDDRELLSVTRIGNAVLIFVNFFIAIYCFKLIFNIFSGQMLLSGSSSVGLVLHLVLYFIIYAAISYEKRLLEPFSGAEAELAQDAGRLNYLSINVAFNLFLVFLNFFSGFIGEQQSAALFLFQIQDLLIFTFLVFFSILNVEFLLRILAGFFRLLKGEALAIGGDQLLFLQIFFSGKSIKTSIHNNLKNFLGLDLDKSEIWKFLLEVYEPVLLFSILLVWLLTSVIIVGPDQTGIITRFGAIDASAARSPGMVFKLPWPFGNYLLENDNRIRIVNVGFQPDNKSRHFIWTRPHSKENFNLIVGEGLEMISIDCQVMYRIRNVREYLLGFQNPEQLIESLAYRFLTFETVSGSFDSIMSCDRGQLAEKLREDIQAELEKRNSGIEIVKTVFLAMHPPIEVAVSFEDVINAQIEKVALELLAETEAINDHYMHKAFAEKEIFNARGDSWENISAAVGKSHAFVSQSLGFNFAPDLAKYRLKLEALEKMLENKKLFLIDASLLRSKDKLLLRVTE